ncbi:MAG: septal ring lytic transglycosylase RlpA family protein, partial [Deltaproteobacteria bacterium]|nr:septal ring lytic transglycosylase RlpA family protein [Deltaproteobacteria bacterium]
PNFINVIGIVLSLLIFSGCTFSQKGTEALGGSQFYRPEGWQKPIKKNSLKDQMANFGLLPFFGTDKNKSSNEPVQAGGFKPDFKVVNNGWLKSNVPMDQMTGQASWYGPGFHGKRTANGEVYDQNSMTAAHRYLPMGSIVRVTNVENHKSVIIRINDRGPYKKNRIIDLTKRASEKLQFFEQGTAKVELELVRLPKDFDPKKGMTPYRQVVVQLAVFRSLDNARRLKNKMSNRFQNISFLIDEPNQDTYHVVAGPFDKRAQAQYIAQALKSDGVESFVRSYRK